jgi:hypothetical protein
MASIYDFTPRQWATVRAALRFWMAAAESSRVHPAKHPAVACELTDEGLMDVDEIEQVLAGTTFRMYVTVKQLSRVIDRPVEATWSLLGGIEPDIIVPDAGRHLYRLQRVIPVIRRARRRHARAAKRRS